MINIKKATGLLIILCTLFMLVISAYLLPNFTVSIGELQLVLILIFATIFGFRCAGEIKIRTDSKNMTSQYYQMETIINNSPFIIFLKDTKGKILLANQPMAKIFNIETEKIIGKDSYNIYADSEIDIEEDRKIIAEGINISTERQLEINNKKYWFKIKKIPIKNQKGVVFRIIVILINIDTEKELEKDKKSYIATLTHDLKTPTFAQLRAAELLLSGIFGELSSEQKEIITQIKSSCNYMNDLIFTILNSYLYENGQKSILPENFNIVELARETSAELSNLLTVNGQSVRIYPESNQMYVFADKFQIKRVIINFLGNAINYGLKNSVINISIKNKRTSINLNVRNKSEYITDDEIKDLFKKFKCSKNAKTQKTGTGLGLYLSKQIIDSHKGKIYAKSDTQQNFDVGFELPKPTSKIKEPILPVSIPK